MYKSTNQHKQYWVNRQIDWQQAYFTPNHAHRSLIIEELKKIRFGSLAEIGCGAGANIFRIRQEFPKVELGGFDISKDAIATAKRLMPKGVWEVGSFDNLFISDKGVDVILTDMALIYSSPFNIDRTIREIRRVTRKFVIFVEFHHKSWLKRMGLRLATGYHAYDYEKLLTKHDFYDVIIKKMPEWAWPGGEPQKTFGYVITARI